MHRNIVIRQRLRGFTLMETVLVIAVGIGLIIGGIVFYEQARVNKSAADIIRNSAAIATEIRLRYPGGAGAPVSLTTTLRDSSYLPASAFQSLNISAPPVAPPTRPQFSLVYNPIDAKVCRRVAPGGLPIMNPDFGTNIAVAWCTPMMGLSLSYDF